MCFALSGSYQPLEARGSVVETLRHVIFVLIVLQGLLSLSLMWLFFYSAGSDDLGDSLSRAIFLRQAVIRHHTYSRTSAMSPLTYPAQGMVCHQEKVSTDVMRYIGLKPRSAIQPKWDVFVVAGYSILDE